MIIIMIYDYIRFGTFYTFFNPAGTIVSKKF